MADGFSVDVAQIRAHVARIDAVQRRFGAVRSASAAISQDDAAYGVLCGWMAGILERRHVRQDRLIAYVEENLRLAADSLVKISDDYTTVDDTAAQRITRAGGHG